MNGVHDMGGMHGFGKVEPDADEHPFHALWEGRVLAMQRALRFANAWNIDMSRDAIERQPPRRYLAASYYERWLMAMELNAVEKGLIDADELAAGRALRPGRLVAHTMTQDDLRRPLTRGSFSRPPSQEARFKPGDRVRMKNINPPTHTRLPRYVRGHAGVIEAVRGCHVFPDSVVTGHGEDPQWLYTVVFNGRELWGAHADPTTKVSVEAFEPYLESA
jgi:nitrile hydratase